MKTLKHEGHKGEFYLKCSQRAPNVPGVLISLGSIQ